MRIANSRELRSRKAELYMSLLPREVAPVTPDDISDDQAYASYLEDVVRLAPAGFGLVAGARRRLSQLGVLGIATLSCATLREVSELWIGFGHGLAELVTTESGIIGVGDRAKWVMLLKPSSKLPRAVAEFYEAELFAATFAFIKELVNRDCSEFRVELTALRDRSVNYSDAFPGPVSFGNEHSRIIGPASAFDWPVSHQGGWESQFLLEQAGSDLTRAQKAAPLTLQIYEFLINRGTAPPTLFSAAAALGISKRTLVRKLAVEEMTFGMLLDGFRRDYALALAAQGGLKAKQIAHLVGLRSENSFRRAFKKWTGLPIGAWVARRP